MSKKIFITILICLIMILNIFMPTIALAAANTVNEVKKDDQINQNEEITDSENNVVDDVENTENKCRKDFSLRPPLAPQSLSSAPRARKRRGRAP